MTENNYYYGTGKRRVSWSDRKCKVFPRRRRHEDDEG